MKYFRSFLAIICFGIFGIGSVIVNFLLFPFIQNKKDWEVANQIGYEKTRYYHYLKIACSEFADTLERYTSLLGDADLLEDLHAYKDEKSEQRVNKQ